MIAEVRYRGLGRINEVIERHVFGSVGTEESANVFSEVLKCGGIVEYATGYGPGKLSGAFGSRR